MVLWSAGVWVRGGEPSVARVWNEECLAAIRVTFPEPPQHARNLYHLSAATYDAWAAYHPRAVGVFHNESAVAGDLDGALKVAISHAAYRVLRQRYAGGVNAAAILAALDARMLALGCDKDDVGLMGPSPAAVGNRCAAAVLAAGLADGSNELNGYAPTNGYAPVNLPLLIWQPGSGTLVNFNRWQPLTFEFALTQNGLNADLIQKFRSPHWGWVTPFALNGRWSNGVYVDLDPGPQAMLGGVGNAEFRAANVEIVRFSERLDPANGEWIDISPGVRGNNPLGTNDGTGHPVNPVTGEPYAPNVVNRADFGRLLAEEWADGPQSETPPGHWNVIAHEVAEHPMFERRLGGVGPVLGKLEWDVKVHLVLNGALHDAAILAWGVKNRYDSVRPVTSVRYMAGMGNAHPRGLPLVPGLIEVVTAGTRAPGGRHEGLANGKIAIRAWAGVPEDPATQVGGAKWMLGEHWLPYQRRSFVTPAFPGYVSGHSTFSRAAAEVLAALTGSAFFPGGMATLTVEPGELDFEFGPSQTTQLQWATYFDAADDAGISRIYGGIHPSLDDGPGRRLGAAAGRGAVAKAMPYLDGSLLEDFSCDLTVEAGLPTLRWDCIPGYRYLVQWSEDLREFHDIGQPVTYVGGSTVFTEDEALPGRRFYRVVRLAPE